MNALARCPVPPTGYRSPEWLNHRQLMLEAFQAQHRRALAIDAGERPPFGDSARRVHGLGPEEPYPAQWREDPAERADAHLWQVADEAEMRALGYCLRCRRRVTLEQVGRCVYTSCGHYRAQGHLLPMRHYLEQLAKRIMPERRRALLEMIGQPAP